MVFQIIKEAFSSKHKNVTTKSSEIDFVTETDQAVEKFLIDGLKEKYPNHRFIGEEGVASGLKCQLTDEPTWIIDPIDGTMNFVHSFPNVCISIALLVNKVVEIGIIYNPVLDLQYTARKGEGAFLNGNPISVSPTTALSDSLVIMELGTTRDEEKRQLVRDNFNILQTKCHGLRALGSCALNMAHVASGGADLYFEFGIHAWDIAAGDLIVREAGGVVYDTEGGPLDILGRRVICASSIEIIKEVIPLLKQMKNERD
ncbi:hypothetical protein QYM36_002343 [Artemia franciscana]|uniref:Inositol-1-monophosphatase n=1 Tax=Artemia franciscana TaxID=6661 RepID=A0AA88IB70_ARTSF|nr:hypothetical protein QYM36_002343 [Artemia franciscana]